MQITKDDAYMHLTGYNLDFFSGLLFSLGDNNNKEIINNIYKTLERVRGKYTSHTPTLSSCGPDPLLLSSQAVLNLSPTLRVRRLPGWVLSLTSWRRHFTAVHLNFLICEKEVMLRVIIKIQGCYDIQGDKEYETVWAMWSVYASKVRILWLTHMMLNHGSLCFNTRQYGTLIP